MYNFNCQIPAYFPSFEILFLMKDVKIHKILVVTQILDIRILDHKKGFSFGKLINLIKNLKLKIKLLISCKFKKKNHAFTERRKKEKLLWVHFKKKNITSLA